jgi:hypothetical protein
MSEPESTGPGLAEAMSALAAEFARDRKETGMALDFQPRTLPLVDRFMKGASPSNAQAIAAYVGEVIRRQTGASWYSFDDRPLLNIGDYQTDPLTTVATLLENTTALEGDVAIESTKAYCDLVCRMQRLWLDGTVLATYESMTALRSSMTPDARLAGWLVGQAQLAVRTAKMEWQESLDFSADSLDAIERILTAIHGHAQKDAFEEAALADAANMWGVYFGEVLRRRYGGQWSVSADGAHQIELSGTTPQPILKVRKRIVEGASDNLRVYFFSLPKAMKS